MLDITKMNSKELNVCINNVLDIAIANENYPKKIEEVVNNNCSNIYDKIKNADFNGIGTNFENIKNKYSKIYNDYTECNFKKDFKWLHKFSMFMSIHRLFLPENYSLPWYLLDVMFNLIVNLIFIFLCIIIYFVTQYHVDINDYIIMLKTTISNFSLNNFYGFTVIVFLPIILYAIEFFIWLSSVSSFFFSAE